MKPELREARAGMLTASMAAVVMGGLRTDGLAAYVNQLAFERLYGVPDDEGYKSRLMNRGTGLEPNALAWYAFDQACELIPGDQFLVHAALPYVGATPDGRLRDRTVQAKCPQAHTWAAVVRAGVVPSEYRWQCRWEPWVSGLWICDFLVWHPQGGGHVIQQQLLPTEAEQMAERAHAVNTMVEQAMSEILNRRS